MKVTENEDDKPAEPTYSLQTIKQMIAMDLYDISDKALEDALSDFNFVEEKIKKIIIDDLNVKEHFYKTMPAENVPPKYSKFSKDLYHDVYRITYKNKEI